MSKRQGKEQDIWSPRGFLERASLYRKVFFAIYDILAVLAASFLSLLVRFEFRVSDIYPYFLSAVEAYAILNILTVLIVFYFFRMYHSIWRFAGVPEMKNAVAASFLVSILQFIGIHLYPGIYVPRSYYILFTLFFTGFTLIGRFADRFARSLRKERFNRRNGARVMIVGAGESTSVLLKEITSSRFMEMRVIALIDDAPEKLGSFVGGVRVMGGREDIPRLAQELQIDEIILSMPSAPRRTQREILDICKETGCKLQTLPGLYQLVNNEVSVSKLRTVEVEDLLGRDPVEIDTALIAGYVNGKTVLITGGGGSIGSELARQVAEHAPARLILLDIYENGVYEIQQELLTRFPQLPVTVLIGSVRNTARMNYVFETYRPQIVYHAAAHKHVPLMEGSPHEAVKNNCLGTLKTAAAAGENGAERFVLISTDKAVNPTNIMGASKRICEMIVQQMNKRYRTDYVAVRFGNVLGSNGSVIPLFKKQIEQGGPVTVTDPEIIRYFMTIPEAVSLVLQAGGYAKGGEIFVLDMGEPVRIYDLAVNLIKLSGYLPNEDIQIVFTGLRPGEKLYEELLMDEEGMRETANERIFIGRPIEVDEERFWEKLEALEKAALDEESDIRAAVKELVAGYAYGEASGKDGG